MKIIETKIPDITKENIEKSKVIIVKNVYPLFDEVYQSKNSRISELKSKLVEKKSIVKQKKESLQELMDDYNREKKVSKLLSRIEKMVDSGLIYDGSLKNQTVILLKVIDKLDNAKIDHHLTETLQIIRKRFSRS